MTQLIPLVLIPLVVLMIILVPIALSLSRRIRRSDAERAELLEHSLSVSEKERIRIAADLHDGPIQDLAGIGYALGAVAVAVPEQQRSLMQTVQQTILSAIESLRQLMVDLYPPDLSVSQLPTTLSDLADPLRKQGIDVSLSVDPLPDMSIEVVTTIYRIAHEALANVATHANASSVTINLETDSEETALTPTGIVLIIADNGVGIDESKLDKRSEGHLGLRLLRTRVEDLGGTVTVAAGAKGGTTVTALLPLTDQRQLNSALRTVAARGSKPSRRGGEHHRDADRRAHHHQFTGGQLQQRQQPPARCRADRPLPVPETDHRPAPQGAAAFAIIRWPRSVSHKAVQPSSSTTLSTTPETPTATHAAQGDDAEARYRQLELVGKAPQVHDQGQQTAHPDSGGDQEWTPRPTTATSV